MQRTSKYVHYYVDVDSSRRASVKHAIFELSCRAGIKFKISLWDGVTNKNGETDAFNIFLSTKISTQILSYSLNGQICFLSSDCGEVLSTSVNSIAGLIMGAEKMLNFEFEDGLELDAYGRVISHRDNILYQLKDPILENNSLRLLEILLELEPDLTQIIKPWVNKCVVSLTHDVDGPFLKDLFSLLRSLFYTLKGNEKELNALTIGLLARLFGASDPYEMFSEWLSVGKDWGRQTFYFFPGNLESVRRHKNDPHYKLDSRIQKHIKLLSEKGQEIGLHSGINCLSRSGLEESKFKLEKVFGGAISGVRSHYWTGVWKNPMERWSCLHEIGFAYDASLNPLGLGCRSGIGLPIVPSFRYSEDLDNLFIVLPTAVMDAYAVRSRENNDGEITKTICSILKNGLCILDWHERVLSNIGPHRGYPSELFNIIGALESEVDLVFLSAQEISNQWSTYVKKCYMGSY